MNQNIQPTVIFQNTPRASFQYGEAQSHSTKNNNQDSSLFEQVEDHQVVKSEATGLGLSIIKEIIAQPTTRILVERTIGNCSTIFASPPQIICS